ncbi:PadR family transcriptional regulator [Allokutzneria sp. A3M-2-11 16]|uniref:PadR family transcriptional regulator n=1 Tax=Allokutzneria sp. A3M-2-11 16 TaxID=2962043 RepID=UPI0020B7E287|nr:PadR family transcriptional regulator [Allokutzneria sp. A3M-2-11 16]MCP3800563.1 PadR family transcriptional regulator [Allokutzneria sp. A3M-2-11 16]
MEKRCGQDVQLQLFICRVGVVEKIGRITPATLDVLTALVWTTEDLHGFALAKEAARPTGTVYVILSRMEQAGWVESYWETQNEQNEGRPRRRFYRLTPDGLASARQTLAERRGANAAPGLKLGLPRPGIGQRPEVQG